MKRFFAGDTIKGDIAVFHQHYPHPTIAKRVVKGLAAVCPHGKIHIRRGVWVTCHVDCAAESYAIATFISMVMAKRAGIPDNDEDMQFLKQKLDVFRESSRNRKRLTLANREPNILMIKQVTECIQLYVKEKGGKK